MADNQKYYYMRLKENFFGSDALVLLESMQDGFLYSNILLKIYLKSLKFNGRLMYNERIPYNPGMLSTLTGHTVGTVEKALEAFEGLGLIEVLDNGAIYMLDIQELIGKSSTEADRKKQYRARINKEKSLLLDNGQMSGQCPLEIESELEPDIYIGNTNVLPSQPPSEVRVNYQQIVDLYNSVCISYPRVKTLSESRKKAIKARLKKYTLEDFKTLFEMAEQSDFLKGNNRKNWSATFDWLITDSNMAKVLDGNYENRQGANATPQKPINNEPDILDGVF